MAEWQRLCELSLLADPGSLGSRVQLESGLVEILLVRRGDEKAGHVPGCGSSEEAYPF